MNTRQNDWFQLLPIRKKIFLVIDSAPAGAQQSLENIERAALKGFNEAKESFGEELSTVELEVTRQFGESLSAPTTFQSYSMVRVVDPSSAPRSESFEISWDTIHASGLDGLVCVFRDTFRNLMFAHRSDQSLHSGLLRSLRHQIGNLVFRITARLDQAKRLESEGDIGSMLHRMRELIAKAERSALRAEPLLHNFAVLGGEEIRPRKDAIRSSVNEALDRFVTVAGEWKVAFIINGAGSPESPYDPLLVHAIWVILENALQAQLREPGGTVSVDVSESDGRLTLLIRDEGPGFDIDPDHAKPHIARRAESAAGRPGLGLPASSRILGAYGACLRVRSKVAGGAEFLVELPLSI